MIKYEDETRKIINACLEVHNELGAVFLEAVYQDALEHEFKIQNIQYEREKILQIHYKGVQINKIYIADFYCYDKIVVETKAVSKLIGEHKAQLINYLKALNKYVGLLVNFGTKSLQWERISIFGLL